MFLIEPVEGLAESVQEQQITREISNAEGSFTVRLGLVQAPDAVYRIDLAGQHVSREQ